jgi:hypothetical protein
MRYARGEAILRVIAMRYAPQLIVSQNDPDTVGELSALTSRGCFILTSPQ